MRVLVVGGGSAGWITAAYLDAVLNGVGTRKSVLVGLIESEKIGRIGVGEATIPTIKRTLERIQIPESVFMDAADATFKQAIRFDNWLHADGHSYYHPFDRLTATRFDHHGFRWLASDRSIPYAETVTPQVKLCEEGLAPKRPGDQDYAGNIAYAYHMDAEKFAEALRDLAVARGVHHVIDDVQEVEQAENGDIAAVKTEGGKRIEADLFVDCTGFARVLIGKTLGAEFESYKDWLLCDGAVAMRVPYDKKPQENVRPYTTATALSSGWVWDIGLSDRRGTGYVFSSDFLSDDEAEAELRAHEGPHCADLPARVLKFNSGRIKTPWVGNCVAIGLAAGFLEPLESTGLYFVEEGVDYLTELFPRFGRMDQLRDLYNRRMRERYEESVDFINMHYVLSKRRDTPFWREATAGHRVTPGLKALFERWEQKPPSQLDFLDQRQLFSHINFEFILYGMEWRPKALEADAAPQKTVVSPLIGEVEREVRKGLKPHSETFTTIRAGAKQALSKKGMGKKGEAKKAAAKHPPGRPGAQGPAGKGGEPLHVLAAGNRRRPG